jgi:phosphoribosylglycinamide formyltransferase-1
MSIDIAWFATGRGEGSRRLLARAYQATQSGEIDGHIAVVFCNRERGEYLETDRFLDQVQSYGIPLVTHSSAQFTGRWTGPRRQLRADDPCRLAYDREIAKLLELYEFDIGMLAGYMLVFGHEFVERYRLLNLHPALPDGPVGTWQQVIWQLIAQGAKENGVMIQRVTADLDQGPAVTYCRYSIRSGPFDAAWAEVTGQSPSRLRRTEGENLRLFRLIRLHGFVRESPLIIATLRAFGDGRLRFVDQQIVNAQGQAIPPLDLTKEIDMIVAESLQHEAPVM